MRSILIFTIAVFVLTACSQTPTSVTPTPLPSMTPTKISTVTPKITPTFSPTLTPTPEAMELSPEIVMAAQEFFGSGFGIDSNGNVLDTVTGKSVPGFRIKQSKDGKSWEWSRTYEYLGDPNFTVTGTPKDIKVNVNSIEMFGPDYKDGEFIRGEITFDGVGDTEVKFVSHSPAEIFAEIMADSARLADGTLDSQYTRDTIGVLRAMATNVLQDIGEWGVGMHTRYKGMDQINTGNFLWGENFVPVLGEDEVWKKVDVTEYLVHAYSSDDSDLQGDKALVVWRGKDGYRVEAVEGDYLFDPKNFSEYWATHDINE